MKSESSPPIDPFELPPPEIPGNYSVADGPLEVHCYRHDGRPHLMRDCRCYPQFNPPDEPGDKWVIIHREIQ